jgi:hypothetical protein
MTVGAKRGVGLVVTSLTALLAGCGAVTATPGPNQPTIGISGGSTSSATSTPAAAPTPAETESNPPGDIPDNQVYVPFTASGGRVSVKVPEGWARSTTGTATQFTDKLNRIEIAPSTASTASTVASVTSGDLPKLKSNVPNFNLGKITTEKRAGSTVVLMHYQGDSPKDPVTGKVVRDAFERYVYFHGGQRLDLTLSGPTNADNVDPWRIVSDSVTWQ